MAEISPPESLPWGPDLPPVPPPAPAPAPVAPAAAAAPRPIKQLSRVLAFAKPHRRLLLLSMALIAFQSAASNARILLLYPIMTRVFLLGDSTKFQSAVPEGGGVVLPASPDQGGGAKPVGPPVPSPGQPGGQPAAKDAPKDPEKDGVEDAANLIRIAERKGGKVLGAFDALIDRMNDMTGAWVPDRWLEKVTRDDVSAEQKLLARAKQRDKYATLFTVGILFLFFVVVMSVTAFLEDFVNEVVRLRILMDVRRELCSKLLRQPISFYDRAHRGDVVQRVLEDVHGFASGLKLIFGSLVEGFFSLLFGIVMLAALSGTLTAVCLLGLPLFIPLRKFTSRVKKQAKKRQTGNAKRVEVLLQMVSGIRTVKAFRSEDRKVAEFHEADRAVYRQSLKVQRTKSLSDAATELLNNVLVMGLTVGGSWLVLRGSLGIGPATLLLFLSQVGNLYKPAKRLVRDVNGMNDSMASVERVFEILDLPPPPPDPADAPPFTGIRDAIRFEHVGFSYRTGVPVLEDVSFEIPKGATVALVGPSGGGKSTLCDLLLRFYEPTSGRITVDGRSLSDFKRDSFLDRTAVVTQDPFLFHASIGENIRQGRPGATDREVEQAAEAAYIHDHVSHLPMGYASEVGERGARLSGGQRQRITIARALIRDPLVLVLDEATASLDAESERAVQKAIDRLREGRTTLVVAHRLSTVKRADRIIVLESGRIVDQGTHEELLARDGLYARLCAMQNLGGAAGLSDTEMDGHVEGAPEGTEAAPEATS